MLNEFAKEWVAALRSGEFKQVRGGLKLGDSYCCLGVACELACRRGLITKTGTDRSGYTSFEGDFVELPTKVRCLLGLNTQTGEFGAFNVGESLTILNDRKMKSFQEIADTIESEPEGLFRS